jgi:hypothetical protein
MLTFLLAATGIAHKQNVLKRNKIRVLSVFLIEDTLLQQYISPRQKVNNSTKMSVPSQIHA